MHKTSTDLKFLQFWSALERRAYQIFALVAEEKKLVWVQNDTRHLMRVVAIHFRNANSGDFLGTQLGITIAAELKRVMNACAHGDRALMWSEVKGSAEAVDWAQKCVNQAFCVHTRPNVAWKSLQLEVKGENLESSAEESLLGAYLSLFDNIPLNSRVFGDQYGTLLHACGHRLLPTSSPDPIQPEMGSNCCCKSQFEVTLVIDKHAPPTVTKEELNNILELAYDISPTFVEIQETCVKIRLDSEIEALKLTDQKFMYKGKFWPFDGAPVKISDSLRIGGVSRNLKVLHNLPFEMLEPPFTLFLQMMECRYGMRPKNCRRDGSDLLFTLDEDFEGDFLARGVSYKVDAVPISPEVPQAATADCEPTKEWIEVAGFPESPAVDWVCFSTYLHTAFGLEITFDPNSDVENLRPGILRIQVDSSNVGKLCSFPVSYQSVPLRITKLQETAYALFLCRLEDKKTRSGLSPSTIKETLDFQIGESDWKCAHLWSLECKKVLATNEDQILICYSISGSSEAITKISNNPNPRPNPFQLVVAGCTAWTVSGGLEGCYPLVFEMQPTLDPTSNGTIDGFAKTFCDDYHAPFAVTLNDKTMLVLMDDVKNVERITSRGNIWLNQAESTTSGPAKPETLTVQTRPTHNEDSVHLKLSTTGLSFSLPGFSAIKSCLLAKLSEELLYFQCSVSERTKMMRAVQKLTGAPPVELSRSQLEDPPVFLWQLTCSPAVPVHKIKEFKEELRLLLGDAWVAVKMQGKVLYVSCPESFGMLTTLKDGLYKFGTYDIGVTPAPERRCAISQPLKNLHLVYFRKIEKTLQNLAAEEGCSIFIPPSDKKLAKKREGNHNKRLECARIMFYLGYLQTRPDGPNEALSRYQKIFNGLVEEMFYLKFDDANLASACREKHIWPMSTGEQEVVVMCRLEGTSTLLVTVFGSPSEVKKTVDMLKDLLGKLKKRQCAVLNEYQLHTLANTAIYVVPRAPHQTSTWLVGLSDHLNQLDFDAPGGLKTNPAGDVTKFYNFSPKEKYQAFMKCYMAQINRRSGKDCNSITVSWDNGKATLRLKGERAQVTAFCKKIDDMLDKLTFRIKTVWIDPNFACILPYLRRNFPNCEWELIAEKGPKAKFWNESKQSVTPAPPSWRLCYLAFDYEARNEDPLVANAVADADIASRTLIWDDLKFRCEPLTGVNLDNWCRYRMNFPNGISPDGVVVTANCDKTIWIKALEQQNFHKVGDFFNSFFASEPTDERLQINTIQLGGTQSAKDLYDFALGLPNWLHLIYIRTSLSDLPRFEKNHNEDVSVHFVGSLRAQHSAGRAVLKALQLVHVVNFDAGNADRAAAFRSAHASDFASKFWCLEIKIAPAWVTVTVLGDVARLELSTTISNWLLQHSDVLRVYEPPPVYANLWEAVRKTEPWKTKIGELAKMRLLISDEKSLALGGPDDWDKTFIAYTALLDELHESIESRGSIFPITPHLWHFLVANGEKVLDEVRKCDLFESCLLVPSLAPFSKPTAVSQNVGDADSYCWYWQKGPGGTYELMPVELSEAAEEGFINGKIDGKSKVVTVGYDMDIKRGVYKNRLCEKEKVKILRVLSTKNLPVRFLWQGKLTNGWTGLAHGDLIEHAFSKKISLPILLPDGHRVFAHFDQDSPFAARDSGALVHLRRLDAPFAQLVCFPFSENATAPTLADFTRVCEGLCQPGGVCPPSIMPFPPGIDAEPMRNALAEVLSIRSPQTALSFEWKERLLTYGGMGCATSAQWAIVQIVEMSKRAEFRFLLQDPRLEMNKCDLLAEKTRKFVEITKSTVDMIFRSVDKLSEEENLGENSANTEYPAPQCAYLVAFADVFKSFFGTLCIPMKPLNCPCIWRRYAAHFEDCCKNSDELRSKILRGLSDAVEMHWIDLREEEIPQSAKLQANYASTAYATGGSSGRRGRDLEILVQDSKLQRLADFIKEWKLCMAALNDHFATSAEPELVVLSEATPDIYLDCPHFAGSNPPDFLELGFPNPEFSTFICPSDSLGSSKLAAKTSALSAILEKMSQDFVTNRSILKSFFKQCIFVLRLLDATNFYVASLRQVFFAFFRPSDGEETCELRKGGNVDEGCSLLQSSEASCISQDLHICTSPVKYDENWSSFENYFAHLRIIILTLFDTISASKR